MNTAKDLTVKNVAEELGLHIDTVKRLLAVGHLTGYKADLKQWRVTRLALDQFKTSGGVKRPGRPSTNQNKEPRS
ncbi:MAG: excisionase family DNA-binding protein [Janthinobacterium lividum]